MLERGGKDAKNSPQRRRFLPPFSQDLRTLVKTWWGDITTTVSTAGNNMAIEWTGKHALMSTLAATEDLQNASV